MGINNNLPEPYQRFLNPLDDVEETSNPLSFLHQNTINPLCMNNGQHPLSALADRDSEKAADIINRLVSVENRKVDLAFEALNVERGRIMMGAQVATTSRIVDAHIAFINAHPRERRVKTKLKIGLLTSETIISKGY